MHTYYRQSRSVQFKTARYAQLSLNTITLLENGSDPDLSFLNSIREVSGYVFIGNNEVKRIPLISLRIIRGRVPYHVENVGDGALIVTRNAKNYTHGLEVLDLRSLTGKICYAAKKLSVNITTVIWRCVLDDLS